jgi:hypothetical protein
MSGLRWISGGLLTLLLSLNCAGSTTDSPGGADSDAPVGGASTDGMECVGAAPAGGCDGVAGDSALEAYARLHTACDLSVRVNRRGAVVCVDEHIR